MALALCRAGRFGAAQSWKGQVARAYSSTSSSSSSSTSPSTPQPHPQHRLRAAYYRGGTSRALLFRSSDLPRSRTQQAQIFRSALGSPDAHGRQLDGLGGGISSLSKICVVGPSEREGADVEFTFASVGVRGGEVDFEGSCGNMVSAVGPFAVDEGMVGVGGEREGNGIGEGMARVRIWNTNTGKMVVARFPVVQGEGGSEAAAYGDFAIDGVSGTAARIELKFLDPAGAKTGMLLPTGNVVDTLDGIRASCIDVGNPCVIVQAHELGVDGSILPDAAEAHPDLLPRLERIRYLASVAMGVNREGEPAPGSIPKIVMVSRPVRHELLSGEVIGEDEVDITVRAISVGQPHRAVPITVAMAVAAAANVEGSMVNELLPRRRVDSEGITLGHSSGRIVVGADFDEDGALMNATVYRTARRLMQGMVYWK